MVTKIIHLLKEQTINNPNWKSIVWKQDKIFNFVRKEYNHLLDLYLQNKEIGKYLILYHYGGLFLDGDTVYLKDITNLIKSYPRKKLFFSEIPPLTKWEKLIYCYLNGVRKENKIVSSKVIYSVKRHPFWNKVIKNLNKSLSNLLQDEADAQILSHLYFDHVSNMIHSVNHTLFLAQKEKVRII